MSEKIYCGNGKVIKTQYGDMVKISLHPDDIQKLVDRSKYTKDRGGWVNLALKERREPSEKGSTHYLEIDMWEPNQKEAPKKEKQEPQAGFDDNISPDDLPF